MTDNEVKLGQDGNSRKMIVVAAGSALLIFLAFIIFARTPKARLNIIQIVSLVVFTVLILRHGRTEGASLSERRSEPPSTRGVRWELLLAPILSAVVYAPALSSYFISDDYYTLFGFRSAPFDVLADVVKHGFLGISFRPAGFVSLILDYSVWRHDPFGYHLTNLLFHLISVLGIYFLCKNLGLDRETSASSSLIFSILPIHPEAVVWISSRFDLMATCLIIWTAVFYWKFCRIQFGIQNNRRSVFASAFPIVARVQLVWALCQQSRRYRLVDRRGDDSSRLFLYAGAIKYGSHPFLPRLDAH